MCFRLVSGLEFSYKINRLSLCQSNGTSACRRDVEVDVESKKRIDIAVPLR